jgi:hypothetical protein
VELTEAHLRRLQRLLEEGFAPVSFPLFPAHVGIQKYGCAAVLEPAGEGRFRIAAQAGLLLDGNISVLVEQGGEQWFVWKSRRVRATAERLGELRRFREELQRELETAGIV